GRDRSAHEGHRRGARCTWSVPPRRLRAGSRGRAARRASRRGTAGRRRAHRPLSACILDASALLAYLHGEPGADDVAEALAESAVISAANWAETLSKLGDIGQAPSDVVTRLRDEGVLGALLAVEPLTEDDAV